MLYSVLIDDLGIRLLIISVIKMILNINIFLMFLKICCYFRVYLKIRFIGYLIFIFSVEIIYMFDMYMYF